MISALTGETAVCTGRYYDVVLPFLSCLRSFKTFRPFLRWAETTFRRDSISCRVSSSSVFSRAFSKSDFSTRKAFKTFLSDLYFLSCTLRSSSRIPDNLSSSCFTLTRASPFSVSLQFQLQLFQLTLQFRVHQAQYSSSRSGRRGWQLRTGQRLPQSNPSMLPCCRTRHSSTR